MDDPQKTLSVQLPPGHTVSSEDGTPLLWLSHDSAPAGLWSELLAEHHRSGLWPLLLEGMYGDPVRPWESQELFPGWISSPGDHDPAELLARWWRQHASGEEADPGNDPRSTTAPYGASWPGPAPAADVPEGAPERTAAECAELLVEHVPGMRMGLVPAASGAEAIAASGWAGPLNYDNDTAVFAAVVADWERRFGVRVLGMGFASLTLAVGAPPTDSGQALRVAAEHFAFCPDNLWQGSHRDLRAYAEILVDRPVWQFWWD
ncbi:MULTISPECIES: DUF4253 domain-containing protein [Nocardiopsis]|nr:MULTISPECIES: DUF4253 domain-containing protein [Nocardiopsis]NKY77195.1 DUF4253 domain-containing protein [Nocardiopsis dassonvillei]